ncbi:RibD family protein [Wenzhouxiangella sp. EGI_FJ10409]|uniref:RibD family protein n=1 Tax=Wenzhouxiangella sp. EGI_FJ10409 TaxID=3243767 RepID=UPI0035D74B86
MSTESKRRGARLCELPPAGGDARREDGDGDDIWQLLLRARNQDWGGIDRWPTTLRGGELTLERSGRWHSEAALDEHARATLDALAPLVTEPRMVVAQLGQSLDGRIATRSGHSHYINGPAALTHLHRLRALVDAVVIGAGTAIADQPRLTVRHVDGSDPVRVIIDPAGRVPCSGPLFDAEDNPVSVLHLVGPEARPAAAPDHVERIRLTLANGGFAPADLLAALESRGLRRILIEGGADTISRFLHAGALDRLQLLIAPLIIGSGRNGIDLPAIDRLDEARRPRIRSFRLEDELLVDVILREPSA